MTMLSLYYLSHKKRSKKNNKASKKDKPVEQVEKNVEEPKLEIKAENDGTFDVSVLTLPEDAIRKAMEFTNAKLCQNVWAGSCYISIRQSVAIQRLLK